MPQDSEQEKRKVALQTLREEKLPLGCILPVAILFSVPWLIFALIGTGRVVSTLSWEPVVATIDSTYISSEKYYVSRPGVGKNRHRNRHKSKLVTRSWSSIDYVYTYEGEQFASNQITRSPHYSATQYRAKWLLQSYPQGATVRAYVNPRHPDQAVLVRAFTTRLLDLFTYAFVFILTFLTGYVFLFSRAYHHRWWWCVVGLVAVLLVRYFLGPHLREELFIELL